MFDSEKLKENAITSIRLGVEDFQRSQRDIARGGDPARTLSAVRNLFAGMLLLFKYRIAASVDDEAAQQSLIFTPPEIIPKPDGKGGVIWIPQGTRKTTIDFGTIKKRLDAFDISVDWTVVQKMQAERNQLEHLHSANSVGVISGFVADLFPVLRDFITSEMTETPSELLGDAWAAMLAHHKFYDETLAQCLGAWKAAGIPERMWAVLEYSKCLACGSPLIRPADGLNDEGDGVENSNHMYVCMACNESNKSLALLEDSLVQLLGGYSPYDGDFTPTETCPECLRETFSVSDGECFWCEAELEYKCCARCENWLNLDDQENGGLCGYCKHLLDKVMKE